MESTGAATAMSVDHAWRYSSLGNSSAFLSRQEPRLWTSEDYRIAVGAITAAAPYYAAWISLVVDELEKDERLAKQGRGGVSGIQVLLSMVEYDVLSIRQYSDMARDIPREALYKMVEGRNGTKEEDKDSVVIMPTPAHLCAALKRC